MTKEILTTSLIDNIKLEKSHFRKLLFIANALDRGWSVKKSKDSYIFTKKHENRREIFQENYLEDFLISNFSSNPLE
jgi:hypothetical protein|uniref:Uncharacterized protein n=1 Tax=viral metagenome TaxID=1070528 RepID=A0A6C0JK90_9ZZZZ